MFISLLVDVDGVVIATNNKDDAADLKKFLYSQFKPKDLGDFKCFLGIEVARSRSGIYICQRHYAIQMLTEAGLLAPKPRTTPMDVNLKQVKMMENHSLILLYIINWWEGFFISQ